MTDELIARLATDLKPVRPNALPRLLMGTVMASGVVAAIAMLMWLGTRADIATAPGTMVFWTKFFYTLSLAVLGGVATLALARPDGEIRWPWLAAPALLAALLVGAVFQLSHAEADQMMPLVIGGTSLVCPWRIVVLAAPILAALLLALRRLAPANPTLAGLAAGLFAGGTGAWVYSFACGENGMMFLALWYTLGIAVVAGVGAVLGRFLLRW
ncbi:MAG: NrsF family protein [Devosia sp.]